MDGLKLIDCSQIRLEEGDRLLLCSDGLYKGLTREQIGQIVEQVPEEEFEQTALILIQAILGGPPRSLDNISILCFAYGRKVEGTKMQEPEKKKRKRKRKRQRKRRSLF